MWRRRFSITRRRCARPATSPRSMAAISRRRCVRRFYKASESLTGRRAAFSQPIEISWFSKPARSLLFWVQQTISPPKESPPMSIRFLLAALVLALLHPALAQASPITYTLTGDFSGTLAGSSSTTTFTNSPFTWTEQGDTASLTTTLDSFPAVQLSTGTIQLPAIGATTSPTMTMYLAIAQAFGAGGFVNLADNAGLSILDSNFFTYNPTLALGPDNVAFNSGLAFTTGLGTLDFTGGSNLVFTADLGSSGGGNNVPEPASLGLLLVGLAGTFGFSFYRFKRAVTI